MRAAAQPVPLALLLLLVSPASAVRSHESGIAADSLGTNLASEAAVEAEAQAAASVEVEAGSASGSGLQAGSLMLDRYTLISVLDSDAWPPGGVPGYTKVGYLGKGAFGETWLARDAKDGKEVAIKFFYRAGRYGAVELLNMNKATPQEKEQLKTAGAECDLPRSIVNAKGTPSGADRFALCLENRVSHPQHSHLVLQVAGTEDLEQYVKKQGGRLRPAEVKRLAKMMLEGLAQMEGHYVHRDIKPANLMVYKEGGEVYLRFIDFGLVVREGSGGGVAGTPMFMPPEMWPVVPRSATFRSSFDVYSTGETIYWLICGKTFHEYIFNRFGGRGDNELQRALVGTEPRTMCKPQAGFEDLYEVVVGGMLKGSVAGRSKASALLDNRVFQGIDTSKPKAAAPQEEAPPQSKPGAAPPQLKPQPPKPQPPKPQVPQPPKPQPFQNVQPQEAPREPSLLDRCHDDKGFWFANVGKCCLTEKYDPKRDAVCARPCGPNVAYSDGKCANNCQPTSSAQDEFSKTKFCCVSRVWKDKCIYAKYLPRGEGWRWMALENL